MRTKIGLFLFACLYIAGAADNATLHKERMDAAQELKDDLKEALDAKSAEKAAGPAGKLVEFAQQEEAYWKKTNFEDVLKLARENLAAAQEIRDRVGKGQPDAAGKAYDKLETSCHACHDLHPEKRKP